jgi:signal transduction histidine kinase
VLFSDTDHLDLLLKLLTEDPDVYLAEIRRTDGEVLVRMASNPALPDPADDMHSLKQVDDSSGIRMRQYHSQRNGIQFFDFEAPVFTSRVTRDREEIGLMFGDDPAPETGVENVEIGSARVVLSSIRSFRELQRIQGTIFVIAGAVAVAGIVISIPLVRITVNPIRQLVQGTKRIAAGDLSQLVVAKTRDEIGELADSFNQMAVNLQKSHDELIDYSQTLEERVRERTQALKRTNEELELANKELRKAQAQLIQAGKMAAMGEFGAGVAHELNQPLAGIKGYTQLLLSMVPEDSELKPRLLQIDRQASRMKEITETMWNLARQSKFEYGFIDIHQPIHDSLILVGEQFRQHRIRIEEELDASTPRVYGDANQLHQVFLNFLTNARDAIDENGEGRVKIRVLPLDEGRYVQVLIMDNGCGIKPEIVDKIFNPFFTTKAPGKGTGLGLSINYSIIEQHCGFTSLYSEPSRGTVVSVILPTEAFSECSREPGGGSGKVSPCWRNVSPILSAQRTGKPGCESCEIFKKNQGPPDVSLAAVLNEFLGER